MITLTPYLTDYKSAAEALAAFDLGKDFVLNDATSRWHGKPIGARDAAALGDDIVIRYGKLRKTVRVEARS